MSTQISDWRAAIDVNDRQLIQLLNIRVKLACELAKLKHKMGVEILDSVREQQVLALARQNNAGPLDHDAVTRIFQSIIEETRRIQASREEEAGSDPTHKSVIAVALFHGDDL